MGSILLYTFLFRPVGEISCDLPAQGWERLSHFLPDIIQQKAWNPGWVDMSEQCSSVPPVPPVPPHVPPSARVLQRCCSSPITPTTMPSSLRGKPRWPPSMMQKNWWPLMSGFLLLFLYTNWINEHPTRESSLFSCMILKLRQTHPPLFYLKTIVSLTPIRCNIRAPNLKKLWGISVPCIC